MAEKTKKGEKRGRKPMLDRSKMTLYFPDQEYKNRLSKIAEGNRRTLNQEIIHALDEHFKRTE